MAKAAPTARAEAAPPGPIFARFGKDGLTNEIAQHDWQLLLREGDDCLLLDMPPQPGRQEEAARLFAALRQGDLTALATSDLRFAGCYSSPHALILFRDALGTRPLHYRSSLEGVAVATMPQELRQHGDSLDWHWLGRRAAMQFRTSDKTAWPAIKRVRPGHAVRIDRASGETKDIRHWQPSCDIVERPFVQTIAQTRAAVEAATQRAMGEAEGPVAMQLTGGLDSSLVLLSAAGSGQRLIALTGKARGPATAIPGDDFQDDAERAAASAQRAGIDHQVVQADVGALVDSIARWNRAMGEPVPNGDNLAWLDPLYRVAAERGAERMLTGSFGNFTTSWPGSGALAEARRAGVGPWLHAMKAHRRHTGASWKGMLMLSFPKLHRAWTGGGDDDNPFVKGVDGKWILPLDRRAVREEIIFGHDPGPWNEAVRRRFGIDEVDVFADRQLVEHCLTLDERSCAHGGQPRAVGRALLRGRMPDALVDEPARGVQGGDWAARIAAERQALKTVACVTVDAGPIDRQALVEAIDAFDPGQAGQDETVNRFDLLRTLAALEFAGWGE